MATGAPDWVRMVSVTVTVEKKAVIPVPVNERAAGGAGKYSGSSGAAQTVVSWTVSALAVGVLKEIMIISDVYASTAVNITVGDVTWCTAWTPTASMPLVFEDLHLAAGKVVSVQAYSIGGVAINVDAVIVAKEVF